MGYASDKGEFADFAAIARSVRASRSARGLRLVGIPDEGTDAATLRHDRANVPEPSAGSFDADRSIFAPRRRALADRDVARENVESAHNRELDPRDPRWRVALETARLLEGPLMTFERRRRVLAFAKSLGVRPFDTHLIIAAMQDRARRGEPLESAMPVIALTGSTRATTAPATAEITAEFEARIERSLRPWPVRMFVAFWPYGLAAAIAFAAHAILGWWLLG